MLDHSLLNGLLALHQIVDQVVDQVVALPLLDSAVALAGLLVVVGAADLVAAKLPSTYG